MLLQPRGSQRQRHEPPPPPPGGPRTPPAPEGGKTNFSAIRGQPGPTSPLGWMRDALASLRASADLELEDLEVNRLILQIVQ